jgi:hypothetical protein
MRINLSISFLRIMALIGVLVGAADSLGMVLHAGRNNHSLLLVLLFVIWVLSPFITLGVANVVFKSWSVLKRLTLYWLTLALTIGSLVVYNGALSSLRTKPAFIFLAVPLASWLLIVIVLSVAMSHSRRTQGKSDKV